MHCTEMAVSSEVGCLNNLDTYRQGGKSRPEEYIIDIILLRRGDHIPFMNFN